MLVHSGLATNLWAEAVNTAACLRNRCITKILGDKTPYQVLVKKATTAQTPILKSDQTWAKSNLDKANVFANYLREVFMPNPNSDPVDLETTVLNCLSEDCQLDLPIEKFSIKIFKSKQQQIN